MNHRISRRRFLRTSAAAGATLTILPAGAARGYAANEGLSFGLVGCGGRGAAFLADKGRYGSLFDYGRVVAMCDVNQKRAAASFAKFPDVPKFEDYRVMLDKMGKEIDAMVVATCDHNHAAPSAAAIRAGKPTYCEKGLTRTIHEARALAELADQYKVVTQEGNNHGYNVRTVECIRAGTIGDVREVHLSAKGGSGPRPLPTGTQDVPAGLNWDLWLGPAVYRPYHAQWMAWGQWRDFANG
jgi:predicted dehydrogenase